MDKDMYIRVTHIIYLHVHVCIVPLCGTVLGEYIAYSRLMDALKHPDDRNVLLL